MKAVVSGGCGFIGSHLVDTLLNEEYEVLVYDNLEEQVHQGKKPPYLNKGAEYIYGDIRDYDSFKNVLMDCDYLFHFASMVGVGQSQYQIRKYMEVNDLGIANLWDILVNSKNRVKKVIVSASMSSYGEGLYNCDSCGKVKPSLREESQLKDKDWRLHCPNCSSILTPITTTEDTPLVPNSIYALGKKVQEEISLMMGKTYGIPVTSLRFFNVYGSRQSLSNPYTGVCAIFMSRIKNNKSPFVFEDGKQSRDFISVKDVVRAVIGAIKKSESDYKICNLGNGKPYTIESVALELAKLFDKDITPHISGGYRKGDVRHCYASIENAKEYLGWEPEIDLAAGLGELIEWAKNEPAFDRFDKAFDELIEKNLIKE
ncbi:MAG: GDP-mannose 4,6-dehydratase [Candidatus Kaelpia imicola]|nr:GDP-mannose 4,6-dehydratase [Candidatus Kaelpia imicola]